MVTEMAGDFRLPRDDRLNNWQIGDTFIADARAGTPLRLGVQAQYLQFDQHTTSQVGGIVNFANLESFLRGRPSASTSPCPARSIPIAGTGSGCSAPSSRTTSGSSARLSANVGLRYEFVTTPTEADGKISNLRNVDRPGADDRRSLARQPVAEELRAAARARLGSVRRRPDVRARRLRPLLRRDPAEVLLLLRQPQPAVHDADVDHQPAASRTSSPTSIRTRCIRAQLQTVNCDLQTPYLMQFNVNVQRALPGDWDVMVGYVGSRGKNLIRLGDANLAPETMVNGVKTYQPQLGRRNPNFPGIWQRVTDAQSFYNSLQVGAAEALLARLARAGRPTRSRDRSTIRAASTRRTSATSCSTGSTGTTREFDRGLSAFHATHNLTFNATWELPSSRGPRPGLARARCSRAGSEQHHDAALRPPLHRAARVQSLRQPEHHRLLACTSGPTPWPAAIRFSAARIGTATSTASRCRPSTRAAISGATR